jgi:Mg2+ and Co2+ transporter CorA
MSATPVVAPPAGVPPDSRRAILRAHTRLYRNGICLSQDFPIDDISEHLADPTSVVWLDLCRPSPADFEMINTEFGLHRLAIEDALHLSQRPKLGLLPNPPVSERLRGRARHRGRESGRQ